LRVLKISCSLLFVAALAQNAGAQASGQSARGSVDAQKAALASGKKAKGIESRSAAQLPARVIINTPSAASVRAPDAARASRQFGAVSNVLRADESAAKPIAAPTGGPRKAPKKTLSAEH
jgi:hypothetical protein